MTPRTLTRDDHTITLAGDPTDGYTCTITPDGGVTVSADGPTPADAMEAALGIAPGSLALVVLYVELLEGLA